MPVICTKEKDKCSETITGRVLEKRRAEIKINNQTLRTFSVKNNSDSRTNSKFFIGTTIPNSTVKGSINWNDTSANTIGRENHENISESVTGKTEFQKTDLTQSNIHKEKINEDSIRRSQNSPSIVSGSEKLRELQELHKQLQKSYEPKPLFAPRRPTLESIKSAIEKAKQENERNKNVGTDDYVSIVTTTDASTSMEKITKKKHKKKKTVKEMQASVSNSSPTTSEDKNRNSRKISVDVKSNKKIIKHTEKSI